MEKKQTAIQWLAEKYNYVTWMRNRDEISAGMADGWRKHYLDQAIEMEKKQIIQARQDIYTTGHLSAEQYYNEIYKSE